MKQPWETKQIALEEVPAKVPNGSTVYIGSTASTAEAALGALVEDPKKTDIQIVQMFPGGDMPHLRESVDRFRTSSFFPGGINQSAAFFKQSEGGGGKESLQDYTPMSITSVPRLLKKGVLKVDVALIKVTPPHKGFCCLGFGVECTRDFARHASTAVIAEICPQMPWTEGGSSKISVDEIDWWVAPDGESLKLKTTDELWPHYAENAVVFNYPEYVFEGIGQNLIREIPDGATLKFGWSPIT